MLQLENSWPLYIPVSFIFNHYLDADRTRVLMSDFTVRISTVGVSHFRYTNLLRR